MSAPALLVLHDVGDEAAGTPWRTAADGTWPGPVLAPDLPGHGDAPAPIGGSYDTVDAALVAARVMAGAGDDFERPVVLGVGANGWAAEVVALGGRASGLVLVDGLGGPWRTASESIDAGVRWLRDLADDPAATGPPPARGLDPRLRHGVLPMASRSTAEDAAAALTVPVLVLSTPADPLPPDDRDALANRFGAGATVVTLPDRSADAVLAAALSWTEDVTLTTAGAPPSGP